MSKATPKKQFTLAQIQDTYFDYLEMHFGEFYKMMLARKMSPHDIAARVATSPDAIEPFASFLPEFLKTIGAFWMSMGGIAVEHAERMKLLEPGSDVPVIPDPFLSVLEELTQGPNDGRVYILVLQALETMQKRAAEPKLVVLPDPTDDT